jgi:hypothetical protein
MSSPLGGPPRRDSSNPLWAVLVPSAVVLLAAVITAHFVHRTGMPTVQHWSPTTPRKIGQAAIDYDRVSDLSAVSVGGSDDERWQMMIGNGDGTYRTPTGNPKFGTFAGFHCNFHGSMLQTAPNSISCEIIQTLDDFDQQMPTDSIYFLFDGQRVTAKIVESRKGYAEAKLPFEVATSLAAAKSAEVEVGDVQYKFTDYQL